MSGFNRDLFSSAKSKTTTSTGAVMHCTARSQRFQSPLASDGFESSARPTAAEGSFKPETLATDVGLSGGSTDTLEPSELFLLASTTGRVMVKRKTLGTETSAMNFSKIDFSRKSQSVGKRVSKINCGGGRYL
jgi:hypothetical protein